MSNSSKLSLKTASELLQKHGLLREMIQHKEPKTDCTTKHCENNEDSTHSKNEIWSLNPYYFDNIDADSCFTHATYDSRDIKNGTLLFIKGNFKSEYLVDADSKGLVSYVAEKSYANYTNSVGLIVNDVRKAMSVLSAAFFGFPQEKLTVVGITGTKGKTTTAYFTHAILNAYSHGKAALFSSVDNCLDGKTYVESDLTTPESFDAFRMMREAVDNGMQYLVMEVSSQAYKVDRVYGLHFNVGAFLNISPDHISPIEHPTFEDYLYCKRQLIANSKCLVLNADADHADLLLQDAKNHNVNVTTFARIKKNEIVEDVWDDEYEENNDNSKNSSEKNEEAESLENSCKNDNNNFDNTKDTKNIKEDSSSLCDIEHYSELITPDYIAIPEENSEKHYIAIKDDQEEDYDSNHADNCEITSDDSKDSNDSKDSTDTTYYCPIDDFTLSIAGDFNYENALAAIAIAGELGINQETDLSALKAIECIKIPGRMEYFKDSQSNTISIVDYAHNYISMKALLDFVENKYGKDNPRITLVTGSAGNKAYDRRKEIVEAAQDRIDQFVFTIEDTDTEDAMDICKDMRKYITNQNVKSHIIVDRPDAVEYSIYDARKCSNQNDNQLNIILIIGKGDEQWIKHQNKHVPYEGDSFIVKRLFEVK